jgi:L-ascorbate metabolism protein UlaG (beta-lactamase superfamily)
MRLAKFGHSCLLVEEGRARMLLDPGSFSKGFEELEGLTAVCFTHQHVDHLDRERLRVLLDRNPGVRVISDEGSAEALGEAGAEAEVVHDGDELEIAGVGVRVVGQPVEVLAVPAGAPWLKVSESVDYLREVRPKVAVPVHEQVLSAIGTSLHYRQLEQLGARGDTAFRVLDDGRPVEL